MDLTLMPLLQQKQGMFNNLAVNVGSIAVEPSFSFMQLLGVLLQSEQNLSGDQSAENPGKLLPEDNDEHPVPFALPQLSDEQILCCISQVYPMKEVVLLSQVSTDAEPGTREANLWFQLAEQSSSTGSSQVEKPGGEVSGLLDLTGSLPGIQQGEVPAGPRTGFLRAQQAQGNTTASQTKVRPFLEPLSVNKTPFQEIMANTDLHPNLETCIPARVEPESAEVELLPAASKVMQQESEGVVKTSQAAEDIQFVMVNSDKTTLKTEVMPKETVDDVASQIIDKAKLFVGKDQADIKLKLKPEFLGHLKLNIRVVKGVVHAHFFAENPAAAGLIEGHLYDLRQSLEQQGISWQQLSVSVGGEQNSQNRTDPGESYNGSPQMEGQGNPSRDEQQKQEVTEWQPGSINYLI